MGGGQSLDLVFHADGCPRFVEVRPLLAAPPGILASYS
jgi:hypothetical protein